MKRVSIVAMGTVLAFGLFHSLTAEAQTRPALVRNVDEPARVPYHHSLAPVCPFLNQCLATFPAVPAGKRLRVTSIMAFFNGTSASGFMALHVDNAEVGNMRLAFPVAPFNGAYYGLMSGLNEQVDVFFEAGHAPMLEFGVPAGQGGIPANPRNRFTISGYLVDVAP